MEWQIPLSDIRVDDELLGEARDALASGWWSTGPRVQAFERAFADLCGTRDGIAVSSGTAALHLALIACDCGPGDEVILPSLNFVAAANVIRHAGAEPVFCDIHGERDLNLDPDDVASAVTKRTKAVLVLHYAGFPCDMDAVLEITRRHGLRVIEDAAHAPGARYRGHPAGSLGDVGCFSFFSNKNLPLGEGGMIVTNDEALASRARLLRSHGMTTVTWDRHLGHAHTYDVIGSGFNYRLDEVHAALGLVQLRRLAAGNEARRRLADRYRERLAAADGVTVPFAEFVETNSSAHHLQVVLLPENANRDVIRDALNASGIQTSVHYPPIHRFTEHRAAATRPLPRTDEIANRLLTLPLYPHLELGEVDAVVDALLAACEDASR